MSKFKIEIAEPCHENWEMMTQSEQGKFCGSCQKNVVDFTHYSNYEIGQFFGKPENANTCGRFLPSQIQETYNYYQPEKSSNFLKYAAGFAGTLLLVQAFEGCKEAPKQCEAKVEQCDTKSITEMKTSLLDNTEALSDTNNIRGIILEEQTGKPFEEVVKISYYNGKEIIGSEAGKGGKFVIPIHNSLNDDFHLTISAAVPQKHFFETFVIAKQDLHNFHVIKVSPQESSVMGFISPKPIR